ncbi:Uu.00g124130.m01.CDS01 [Anthostomella pinea]|uniref:Uu.00g124130.m01.CDS01 n=1 Tax=Anthostomella pinea TaxID=933095 RepID=A0AAI8VIJ8_9PEZI|nr:Uu.00g124130.m01.CDS01 [Anthostomella pinea]
MAPKSIPSIAKRACRAIGLIWDFTESNFGTFVVPNTAFGILGGFAAEILIEGLPRQPSPQDILQRLPTVILFNWCNVLIFDLANQRYPESVQEDILNKPWRPIPAGKITADQTRRAMLVAVPMTLTLNYILGVWRQGIIIQLLTWLYNDLRGGDEVIRDLIIAVAYGMFNSGSLELATGCQESISQSGIVWVSVISGVILTTMQVQDLKDQAGDSSRGRKTVALFLGEQVSRVSIAVFVCFWSLVCPYFWCLDIWAYVLPVASGAVVAARVLLKRTPAEDSDTWKWWCFWTVTLYLLPVVSLMGI